MKLYEFLVLLEGGNVFPNTSPIKKEEVLPTLKYLEKQLGISGLDKNLIGSSGKKDYSGDLDVALDFQSPEQVTEFERHSIEVMGEDNVRRQGKSIFIKCPVQNFQKDGNRTGYVQVDFMFSDVEFAKVYHHSPAEGESQFKGAHRNLILTAVASYLDRGETEEKDGFGRPVKTIRWKWSPIEGLFKVERESRKNPKGEWIKKQYDVPLNTPTKNPAEIAKILFKGKAGVEALNSLESVIDAVKKAYTPDQQQKIFKKTATNFMDSLRGNEDRSIYPPEIKKYMPQ